MSTSAQEDLSSSRNSSLDAASGVAISGLLKAGQRITFARVAREANVSTWFVHDKAEVKAALLDAMNDQARHGAEAVATPRSKPGIPADLRLARPVERPASPVVAQGRRPGRRGRPGRGRLPLADMDDPVAAVEKAQSATYEMKVPLGSGCSMLPRAIDLLSRCGRKVARQAAAFLA
ncbi:hypothetical protein [Streptomyces sp. NPDC005485]|uniref:hypothetical protein n=1 Tax=Streptomyces sp. NPDC005485 TaxID=3155591 RepID=UPI0033AFC5B8